MKTLKINWILLLTVCAIAFSCKPDEDPSSTDRVSATWKVSQVVINGTKDVNSDYSGYSFTFSKDLTYSFSTAPVSKVETTGKWKLSDDAKTVTLTGTSGTATSVPVAKLDASELHLVFTIPATFKHDEQTAVFQLKKQ